MSTERPDLDETDEDVPQLSSDVDDAGGRLPAGEAQDRRGPEPPAADLLSEHEEQASPSAGSEDA